jgi:hypothetical protein
VERAVSVYVLVSIELQLTILRVQKLDFPLRKLRLSFAQNHLNSLPYHPTPDELQQVIAICKIFQRHLSNLFDAFRSHCITDISDPANPISVFLKENFLLFEFSENDEEQEFMKSFMETQLFFDYCDKQLQQKDGVKVNM